VRIILFLAAAVVTAGVACSGSGNGGVATPPSIQSFTAAPSPDRIELDGETYVYARTLPASALSSDSLRTAGSAVAPNGAVTPVARGDTKDVGPWELVSSTPDGWRVWWPGAISETLEAAGPGAALVSVTAMEWPDACLGFAHPGEVCAQVITDGYVIAVEHDGERAEYHASAISGARRTAP
jgi:hypothetical protein